jgi:hypothetical protein
MSVPAYSHGIHGLRGNPPTEKLCARCDEWKPLEAFRPNHRDRTGLNSYCKDCQLERTREWRAEHPDYEKNYNEKRRAAYPAKRRRPNYPANRRSPSRPEAA